MNTVLAAQMRALIQEMIKKYKDGDSTLTPKELNDLASAAKNTAAFSNEVYAGLTELPKPAEQASTPSSDEPDFSKLGKPIDIKAEEIKDGKAPNTDTGTSVPGLSESNPG